MMPKVSIIILVYNSENFIERCVHSLFAQSLEDIEYIFVDDCSSDNSVKLLREILDHYPERVSQVKIIRNKTNLKQAESRSIGLKVASGEYVIYCDSDDWVEYDMYELMYYKATISGADIVACDFVHERNIVSEIYNNPVISSPKKCIREATMNTYWSLWNRLVRRELITKNQLDFVEGINMWEDLCFMIRCYYFANKIEYVSKPLYHYNRTNEQSITNVLIKNKLEQQKRCIDFLDAFFVDKQEDFSGFIQMYRRFLTEQDIYNSNQPVFANLQRGGFMSRLLYKIVNVPRKIKTTYLIHSINKK